MANPPSPMANPAPWDLVSAAYAEEIVPVFEQYARDALRLAAPPAGSRVVDVACGPGTLSFVAAEAGHPVDALDFSPQMIAKLEGRKQRGAGTAIAAQVGDGQTLPYPDATFGAGFSMFGLMFFPDRAAGFRELRRVLVPGAKAVVSSWQRLEDNPVLAAMFATLREQLARVLGASAPKPGSSEMPLVTADACRTEMSEAFAEVEVHAITHEQKVASIEAIWPGIERTMAPIAMMRRSLGAEKWAPIAAAANEAIVKAMGSSPPVMKLPAWVSVGTAR